MVSSLDDKSGVTDGRDASRDAGERFTVATSAEPRHADAPGYVSPHLDTRYAISVADTRKRREEAARLMRRLYQWRGYSADIVHEAPDSVTLVASESGRVVATVTVGLDSHRGLAVDALYAQEAARLRRQGARLCEFTRLAVGRVSDSLELLGVLFHAAYLYAHRVHDATHLLAEVNPRHVRFYERMLGFQALGEQRMCARVGAPAVLLALPLDHAERQIGLHGGGAHTPVGTHSLYPYFLAPSREFDVLARLFGRGRAFHFDRRSVHRGH